MSFFRSKSFKESIVQDGTEILKIKELKTGHLLMLLTYLLGQGEVSDISKTMHSLNPDAQNVIQGIIRANWQYEKSNVNENLYLPNPRVPHCIPENINTTDAPDNSDIHKN